MTATAYRAVLSVRDDGSAWRSMTSSPSTRHPRTRSRTSEERPRGRANFWLWPTHVRTTYRPRKRFVLQRQDALDGRAALLRPTYNQRAEQLRVPLHSRRPGSETARSKFLVVHAQMKHDVHNASASRRNPSGRTILRLRAARRTTTRRVLPDCAVSMTRSGRLERLGRARTEKTTASVEPEG